MKPSLEQLPQVLRDHGLQEIQTLRPTDGGESGNAFRATDRSGKVSIVKVLPAAGLDTENQMRDLDTTVRRLQERGYPAPWLRDFGYGEGQSFWMQELLPGTPLNPGFVSVESSCDRAELLPAGWDPYARTV